MEVTNTPTGKVPTGTAQNAAGGTEVARSGDSAKRQDLNFITKNNQIDAEYQLPIAADAQGTWVSCALRQIGKRSPVRAVRGVALCHSVAHVSFC